MYKVIGAVGLELLIVGFVPLPPTGISIGIIVGSVMVGCVFGAIADNLQLIGN